MEVFVELALDHPTLPLAEARAIFDLAGGSIEEAVPGIALGRATPDAASLFSRRAALAFAIGERWADEETSDAFEGAIALHHTQGRSFAVRVRRVEGRRADVDSSAFARGLGERLLGREGNGPVRLDAPDVEIHVLLSSRIVGGPVLARVDRKAFEARHVRHRPFFSPVVLHPRTARALVNLARIRPGDRVLDPFCGTGGLLLEAGLVGARVWASDIDPRMVAGTRLTLEHFGIGNLVAEERDVGEAPEFVGVPVDAIVSDPPYGRSATMAREEARRLYGRFFSAARQALKQGGRLVAGFPRRAFVDEPRAGFALEEAHDMRVHKSLTRTFGVWRRTDRA